MINDMGISNLYHYTYRRTVKSRFFVKRNPALFIELPSASVYFTRGRGNGTTRSRSHGLALKISSYERIVSIYRIDIYIYMIFYWNARPEGKGDKIGRREGIYTRKVFTQWRRK